MQTQEGTFIRYTHEGKEHHIPYSASNLLDIRRIVGGGYTMVKGFGVFNADNEFDFYSSKESIPAAPLMTVNSVMDKKGEKQHVEVANSGLSKAANKTAESTS